MNNVLWYLRRLQRSCCLAADLLLTLSLSCGFAHGEPKHPPTPPLTPSIERWSRPQPSAYVCTANRFSTVTMSISSGFVWVSRCNGETFRHYPHSHLVEPCMASVLYGVCCSLGPNGGRMVLTLSPPQGDLQKPTWMPGVCPRPLPGRLSLWYILALGNIDLNALCFDLNQLLPVYLYRWYPELATGGRQCLKCETLQFVDICTGTLFIF